MNLKNSLVTAIALTLSTSVLSETTTTEVETSFFDILAEKQLTLSAGRQSNTLESGNIDLDFDGTYFSASFKPTKEFKISASYFTSETDTVAEYSMRELWNGLPQGDDDALLDAFGLDYTANGWGATFDESGAVERYFKNSYFVSTSFETNEFELGAAYVINFSSALNYNVYLGYISGELVTNQKLSNKLVFRGDYSEIPSTLLNYINSNDFNVEGITDSTNELFEEQDYIEQYGYRYRVYPDDNLNAHDASTSIGYNTFVMKIEADFEVTDNLHLIAGLSSESTNMDDVDEDLQDTVYSLGASYTIWNGVGVQFAHKIYDGQTKTSVGLNYAF